MSLFAKIKDIKLGDVFEWVGKPGRRMTSTKPSERDFLTGELFVVVALNTKSYNHYCCLCNLETGETLNDYPVWWLEGQHQSDWSLVA